MSKSHGVSSKTHTQQQLNHYANQHNPNNAAYRAANNNHSNQCNPNNAAYRSAINSNSDRFNSNDSTIEKYREHLMKIVKK